MVVSHLSATTKSVVITMGGDEKVVVTRILVSPFVHYRPKIATYRGLSPNSLCL